eukprot:scaffold108916_cov39-Cyclotella_meneghiniana.AAC.2
MIHCLKTSRRNRAILSDYRNRAATRWDEEEAFETMQHYKHRFRKNAKDLSDDIDAEINHEMSLGLSERYQREIMLNANFADEILNQINKFVSQTATSTNCDKNNSNEEDSTDESSIQIDDNIPLSDASYPVESNKFNSALASKILEKSVSCNNDEEEDPPEHDTFINNNAHTECSLEEMARQLIASKHLSQDKLCIIDTVIEHFLTIRNRSNTVSKKQSAPNLLVTGKP